MQQRKRTKKGLKGGFGAKEVFCSCQEITTFINLVLLLVGLLAVGLILWLIFNR